MAPIQGPKLDKYGHVEINRRGDGMAEVDVGISGAGGKGSGSARRPASCRYQHLCPLGECWGPYFGSCTAFVTPQQSLLWWGRSD